MPELLNLHVDAEVTKILVIDVQNDVCDNNSAYANSISSSGERRDVTPLQEALEKGLIPFLERARHYALPIGFIQSVYQLGQYSHSGISGKWLTIDPELKDPEWRIKIYREMPLPGEPIFRKDTQEIFRYNREDNRLYSWLQGAENILVAGFTTDGCVKKGVYALLKERYKPIVLEDCVATSGHKIRTAHLATLDKFRSHEIIRLINSARVKF